jgi:N-acetylglucosamine-6-sulfatase
VGHLTLNVDIAPTIAAATEIAASGEGRNLLPLILGTQRGWRGSFLFEHYMQPKWGIPAYCAFRGQRWKYVQYATGEEELYDPARDPYELRSQHRVRTQLIMEYRKRVRRSACRPPGYRPR